MTVVARPRSGRSVGAFAATAALLLAAILLIAGAAPAAAQGFGWFGQLFGGGQPQRAQPAYPGYDQAPYVAVPRRRTPRRHPVEVQREAPAPARERERQPSAPPPPPPPPKNATVFVYVLGDSMGQLLANGLDDALSDRQDVGVVHKARGSTGLVASDYFDWPKAVDALVDGKDKIDVAVMMIGTNDNQPIREDGQTYAPGSDGWNVAYKKRVMAIDEAFLKKKIPLIWVGVPITKNSEFADKMAAFNDIYREAAAKTGATYVDTWEAFSDANGDFNAFGPDINGQNVRLRASDGIHFTRAGARKLAHFVETHVRRDLDGKAPRLPPSDMPVGAPPEADAGKGAAKPVVAAVKPDAGPVKSLNALPTAANGRLAAPPPLSDDAARDILVHDALVRGETHAAPAGRADNARWPSGSDGAPN